MEPQGNPSAAVTASEAAAGADVQRHSLGEIGWSKRLGVLMLSLLSLALVSYTDWITGDEGLFFIFYFVPVAFCAWRLGQTATVLMALCAGVGWYITDLGSGHRYTQEWLRYWNASTCFVAFAILGIVMYRWQRSLREQRRAAEELAAALQELRKSTVEIRKLQGQLQVVCAWTKRIKIDERWIPLDEYLTDKLHVPISHGISPEAFEELKKSLK